MKKKCKVVMLPTNEKAGLGSIYKRIKDDEIGKIDEFDTIGKLFINKNPNVQKSNSNFEAQHLYILSDEEIKEGDFGYNIISKTIDKFTKSLLRNKEYYKKIIVATDKSLLKPYSQQNLNDFASLPQPTTEFIQQYVDAYNSGNPIEEVEVEYEQKDFVWVDNKNLAPYYLKLNSQNQVEITIPISDVDINILGMNIKSDKMLLPEHYELINEPYYMGDGNHSINQLEHLCNSFKEYCHQQAIIKQKLIETVKTAKHQKLSLKELCKENSDLRNEVVELCKKAYLDAILITGEGYNGEYADGNDPDIEIEFKEPLNNWISQNI